MFIDYVPLLLINMVAGLFLLAFYLLKGMEKTDKRSWGLAFAATAKSRRYCLRPSIIRPAYPG